MGLSQPSAYLLVSHGSRDPRPQAAIAQLVQRVQQTILASNSQSFLVGAAVLECALLPLHEQIQQFSQTAIAQGIRHIQLVPLFLIPGVHVMEDIPEQVTIARQMLDETVTIALSPHIGTHPGLEKLVAHRLAHLPENTACILMSHGSRRSGGNQPVEALASKVGAVSAYWSVAPKLETRLQELSQSGCRKIAILPHFLFIGGITDAISQTVAQLTDQFPDLDLDLRSPLEVGDNLAQLILDLICT